MAIQNKLYPPVIKGVLPAFYKTGDIVHIKIPFAMNQMVGPNVVKSMYLRLKTVQTNIVKYCDIATRFNTTTGIAEFDFSDKDNNIIPGVFYKAQLAYCESSHPESVLEAGYFSTVGIIKCITKPIVEIANLDNGSANSFNNRYLGVYTQDPEKGDINEKVYSYCFTIEDEDNNIYATSGIQLHNTNNDVNSWSSQDEFLVNKTLPLNKIYYLKYNITTVNGLELSSPIYPIMAEESINMEKTIRVLPKLNFDEGYIKINFLGPTRDYIDPNTHIFTRIKEDTCTGLFLLSRASVQDDYMIWHDIARFNLNGEKPSLHTEYDFTIEQGITYKYRLQQYNISGVYSNPVYSEEIYADFEDMFLYDGVRQLKVRFNPKVSSFKVDIPEQKLETIGSKYPYIFRNGNVYYHEFPISGLISYQLDEAKLFLNEDEQLDGQVFENNMRYEYTTSTLTGVQQISHEKHTQTAEEVTKQSTVYSVKQSLNNDKSSPIRIDKDLTSENLMSERYFKLAVLSWLTNGEVKLFRSPGEGNYLVRLLNTSMTPNDTLGRMLHTFNTTAYEIADLNYDNLLKYKLLTIGNPENNLLVYTTEEFQEPGIIYHSENGNMLYHFEVNDCMPGDQFILTFADGSQETITIGITGSYSVTINDNPIVEISFEPVNPDSTYPHLINLEVYQPLETSFDLFTSVNTQTLINQVYCGPCDNVIPQLDIPIGLGAARKVELLNIERLHIMARDIIPLYEISKGKYATTPFGVGRPIKELVEMNEESQEIINRFAIFAIYKKPDETQSVIDNVHHLDNETINDKQYNELYPDWEFKAYYDYPISQSSTLIPDRSFTIDFDDNNSIDLSERKDITLYNLGSIPVLRLGNGVIAEITARIRVFNYSIENTDDSVASEKKAYLNMRNKLYNDYNEYIDSSNEAWTNYRQYQKNKIQYEELEKAREELNNVIDILSKISITGENERRELLNITNIVVQKINKYNIDFVNDWNNTDKPSSVKNLSLNSNIPPYVLNENTDFDEIVNNLKDSLNNIKNIFDEELENFRIKIPQIDSDILNNIEFWEQDLSDIVAAYANRLLPSLSSLYEYLHKQDSTSSPFTSDFFNNNQISTTEQWEQEDAEKVYQKINQVSINDRITKEDLMLLKDTYQGQLIEDLESLISAEKALGDLEDEYNDINSKYETANANFNEIQVVKDYESLSALISTEQENLKTLQSQLTAVNNLLESLNKENNTEGNQAAINYLTSLKTNYETLIEQKNKTIRSLINQQEAILPNYQELLNNLNDLSGKRDNLSQVQLPKARSAVNSDEEKLNTDIQNQNNNLEIINNYIQILLQVESLRAIAAETGSLNTQIEKYNKNYNDLYGLNNYLYNIAFSAIEQISTTKKAFEDLINKKSEWEEKLEKIKNQIGNIDMTIYEKPEDFNMEERVEEIAIQWRRFITALSAAYAEIETRYLV